MKTKEEWMALALDLAEATNGQTSPNPSVGAVVVKDGILLGVGTHLQAGEAHAEVHALEQAKEQAEGADIYVTLEPCAHFGKTPPCAELIIQRKLKRVYVGCVDPNPKVAGKGIQLLRDAGIEVEVGILEERARNVNQKFFHYMSKKLPYVTLKAAMTLDGKTATSTGDSKWITSEEARVDVHRERHSHDAILVGKNTVLLDNPSLTTRLPQGGKNPIRIILDSKLSLTGELNILDKSAPTWIVTSETSRVEAFRKNYPHIKVIHMPGDKLVIRDVLERLYEEGVQSIYVEGGGTVHASFLQAKLFDQCHWYIAPRLLGGVDARSVVGGISPQWMSEATYVCIDSVEKIGPDIKIIAKRKEEA